ncbi:hypothetical protein [Glycomyces paridis]|uniref:Uncharacterized protein n=1 Tax=Glycomyces paridis TaxID=2126555 RepID=A0A4S8PCL7_9ACTN|nr:hypothetical protein [Glycomyces paridis]THV28063.1 hypothetical protein E9998_13885 [Glycomyces paridis]
MRRWTTALGTTAALAVLAAVGACTDEGSGGSAAQEAEKVDLVDLLNENERLFGELWETESTVIRVCLEDQGFTVHDEEALHRDYATGVDPMYGLQEDSYDFQYWLPTSEMAPEWGFGVWLWNTGEDEFEAREEYNALLYPDQVSYEEVPAPDNSAFEALGVDERIDWYEAYMGEEKMAAQDLAWHLRNPDATESEVSARQAEAAQEDESGDIEFEDEFTEPKPGGCELSMIESLYGEPELVEEEMEPGVEEGMSFFTWEYRPEAPMPPPTDLAGIDAAVAAETDAFLTCVADAGFGEWTLVEGGGLPVTPYFDLVYTGESISIDGEPYDQESMPEPPEDLPDDFEGKKAYEIEMAVAFAACADEAGYREAVMAAHDEADLEAYRSIETDLFAYQESLREALTTAQELIEA